VGAGLWLIRVCLSCGHSFDVGFLSDEVEKVTQAQIAEAAGVNEASLRCYIKYLARDVLGFEDAQWRSKLNHYLKLTRGA
jgi:hypothetical protein